MAYVDIVFAFKLYVQQSEKVACYECINLYAVWSPLLLTVLLFNTSYTLGFAIDFMSSCK